MKILIQASLFVLMFNLSTYALNCDIMVGDINRDGVVGLDDLAIMIEQWLECTDPQVTGCVQAATAIYDIPHNGLADHGQASVTGTIAWYMATYASNDIYRLSSNAEYYTSQPLIVPTNSILTVAPNVTAMIKADGNSSVPVYDKAIIVLQNGSQIFGRNDDYTTLTINANRLAKVGIDARNSTNSLIADCTVIDTLNTYTTSGMRFQHLIDGDGTFNLTVKHCFLRNAGYPALNFESYDSVARGISVCDATNPKITNCDIAYTMGSSVAIARTVGAEIEYNILEYSGRCNAVYGKSYSEDSVIGYHNTGATVGVDKRCYIRYNLIRYYGNHGIHVSGKGFHIDHNQVYDGALRAIYLGDWRTPGTECSSDSTVTYNYVEVGSGVNYSLYFDPYQPGTIDTTGNTGEVVTYWGATCSN